MSVVPGSTTFAPDLSFPLTRFALLFPFVGFFFVFCFGDVVLVFLDFGLRPSLECCYYVSNTIGGRRSPSLSSSDSGRGARKPLR